MSTGHERIALLAFSDKGNKLAQRLQQSLGGEVTFSKSVKDFSLTDWTAQTFMRCDALIFVGAVGIAVRAVAPYLKSKATDPAVVVIDECGRFAVPLVSGHLGGANDLAREISAICGAVAVVTTATDGNGVFAVDEWAKRQNCAVADVHQIKRVSAKMLAGEIVHVKSGWPIEGRVPDGLLLTEDTPDVVVDYHRMDEALCIVPKRLILGVGCRRGTSCEALEAAFGELCEALSLWPESVCRVATIDVKADEEGLLAFCKAHGWPLSVYSAEELRQVEGDFTASEFVAKQVGVDNVCERSAVKAAGGVLIEKKRSGGGITMALAEQPFRLDWRWQYE